MQRGHEPEGRRRDGRDPGVPVVHAVELRDDVQGAEEDAREVDVRRAADECAPRLVAAVLQRRQGLPATAAGFAWPRRRFPIVAGASSFSHVSLRRGGAWSTQVRGRPLRQDP